MVLSKDAVDITEDCIVATEEVGTGVVSGADVVATEDCALSEPVVEATDENGIDEMPLDSWKSLVEVNDRVAVKDTSPTGVVVVEDVGSIEESTAIVVIIVESVERSVNDVSDDVSLIVLPLATLDDIGEIVENADAVLVGTVHADD